MRQLQPVLWTKGLLLSPQHLQTQDRYLDDLLRFRLAVHALAPWGFARLAIDREALAGGVFALGEASGLFPDGLAFDIPDGDAAPAPRPLEGLWAPDQEALEIYLAIPEQRRGGVNVSAGDALDTRWRAEEALRRDDTTGLAERPIQVARKNLRLLVEGESLEGQSVLRVARLRRAATGESQLDPRHVPPLLDIRASEYLVSIARRLVEILAARSDALAGLRRQRSQSVAEFGLSDTANFWLLHTVNSHFPVLRHHLESPRTHPAALYEAMLALAGALTTYSATLHPGQLPVYEHERLSGCFTELDERIREMLDTVVASNAVTLPLRVVQPSVHATAIEQDRYLEAPQLFLAVSAEGRASDIVQRFPQLAKVSSADRVETLIRQALPGLGLVFAPTPPAAVAVKANHFYFALTKAGAEWAAIQRARNLAAYVPADFPGARLELVVVLPR